MPVEIVSRTTPSPGNDVSFLQQLLGNVGRFNPGGPGGVRGDSATAIGSKQGALTASIFSQVPIVTIEMVDLSNKADADFIKSEAGQKRMAHAISAGVAAFATPSPEN